MIKNTILACLLLAIAFNQAWTQSREPLYKGGAFYFEAGLSALDLSEINQIINVDSCDGTCFPPFDKKFFAFGIGGQAMHGKWIFAGSATTYMIGNPGLKFNSIKQASLTYYYGSMKLGYLVYRQEKSNYPLLVYPTVGVTGALVQLRTNNNGGNVFPALGGER